MDEFTHRILAEAYKLDDEVKADYESWDAQRARKQQQQQPKLVRKEFYGDQPSLLAPVTQPATTEMDAAKSAQWNRWAEQHVNILRQEIIAWIESHTDIVNANTVQSDRDAEKFAANFERRAKVDQKLRAELDDLRATVLALRCEIKQLREQKNGYCG